MAISNDQKLDYLFKKLGYGVAKTDINSLKTAVNEAISSPLLLRGDKIWGQAAQIPSIKPQATSGVVEIYTGLATTADITSTQYRTWVTGFTDWVPTEFGSTYQVEVYAAPQGEADPVSNGTKLFASGSGNDDEWFFDYQAGILHFIGQNLPSEMDGTNDIFISGARYVGPLGITTSSSGEPLLDATGVTSLVDSNYIFARIQDSYATIGFVNQAIDQVIGLAPEELNTLQELAEALNNDSNAYNNLLTLIEGQLDSAEVINLIDSDYVQQRQDFLYSSLQQKPNILDSADVLNLIPEGTGRGLRSYTFQGAAGDTEFSGADYYGNTLTYSPGSVVVFLNGVLQLTGVDFTAGDKSSVIFSSPVDSGDIVNVLNVTSGGTDSALINLEIIETVDSDYVIERATNLGTISSGPVDLIFNDVIDTFSKSQYRSVKYFLQLDLPSANKFHFTEIVLLHDDTDVYMTEYGVLTTDEELGTFDAEIVGDEVRLLCTPAYQNTNIKTKRISNDV